ncbi:MAG TPA: glycosyltransferase family 4 protein [Desulfomonilaceae bacterium]|nr:glycosyltransferase family 4 protein [Desulfomonilaceae bacterium]
MANSDPLRLLMITHSVYVRDTRVRRYVEPLAEEGHLVDIICLASEDGGSQSNHPNITVHTLPITRSRREGWGHVIGWANAALMMFLYTSKLDIRNRYDLIHVHNMPDFLVFCALIPRLRGCPIILNIHDPTPELAQSKLQVSESHILVRAEVLLEKISIRFSSHIITATPTFENALIRRGVPRQKITVIMNAADPRFSRGNHDKWKARRTRTDKFTLLYVGTVADRYGLQIAVRALPVLRPAVPGIKLKIVPKIRDEGKALDDCLELANTLGVRDLIEVDGPVPLEQMPDIMRDADIGIYPALRDCHMDIALSLKIPEMASVGLCIVSTRLPVLEELYGDESIAFVPPGDHMAFAAKILELYGSPDFRERLARKAMERSAGLTWDSQYRVYRELLRGILGR